MRRTNVVRPCRADLNFCTVGRKQKARRQCACGPFAESFNRSLSLWAIMTGSHQNALAMPNTMTLLQSSEPKQSASLRVVSLYISDRFTPEKGMVSDTL